jgi:hypothetical protein
MEDWDLIVWAIRGPGYKLVDAGKQSVLLDRTWALQDGYGEAGFTPVQGWDWSGIRDSSDVAIKRMANEVRRLFALWQLKIPS